MKVFNFTKGMMTSSDNVVSAIVKISDTNYEFGYCDCDDPLLVKCLYRNKQYTQEGLLRKTPELESKIIFSVKNGMYMVKLGYTPQELLREMFVRGLGRDMGFPYRFRRNYEAAESFEIFKGKQVIDKHINFELSKYLKYTFGLEFETSQGFIPEDICFKDGLIPLRDGSIQGLEYSTVVLDGNNGLNLLAQQLEHLKKYTYFDKECALHIHLGGFPIDAKAIFILYQVLILLEGELEVYIPRYSLKTSMYKASHKDYCNPLPRYSTFNAIYEGFVEQEYFGNLYQPHPKDPERSHKWDCHAR